MKRRTQHTGAWDDDAVDRLENYHRRDHSLALGLLVAGLLGFIAWASLFRIDQVARATGEVIASSRVQIIQAVDGGVLEALYVKEGDRVERGQRLALLDTTRVGAAVKEIEARVSALEAKSTRLRAEVTGAKTLVFPETLQAFPDLIQVETALFEQRRRGLTEELRTLEVAAGLASEELKMVQALAAAGDVSRTEVIRAERTLNEAEAERINRKNHFLEEARVELASAEDEIAQNVQVLTQRQQQVEDSTFVASVPGIVKNVRVTTVGGVLRAGEELMEIVPIGDDLIVEAKVSPADIAQVRSGLEATIRFDPYDYTLYGAVMGEVALRERGHAEGRDERRRGDLLPRPRIARGVPGGHDQRTRSRHPPGHDGAGRHPHRRPHGDELPLEAAAPHGLRGVRRALGPSARARSMPPALRRLDGIGVASGHDRASPSPFPLRTRPLAVGGDGSPVRAPGLRPRARRAPASAKEIHPLGKFPMLEDGDTVLAESGAILSYLVERHARDWVPQPEDPAYATYQQLMHWTEGSAAAWLVMDMLVCGGFVPGVDPGPLPPLLAGEIASGLDWVESLLESSEFACGDAFTAADPMLTWVLGFAESREHLGDPAGLRALPRTHACAAGLPARNGTRGLARHSLRVRRDGPRARPPAAARGSRAPRSCVRRRRPRSCPLPFRGAEGSPRPFPRCDRTGTPR